MNKKTANIPRHIAIIMDGNRRWAKKHNLSSFRGHKQGCEQFRKITEVCYKMGVKILTVYAFSNENWKRSKSEVSYLMRLTEVFLKKELLSLTKNNIRLNAVGQIDRLPEGLKKLIKKIMEETKDNTKGILNIAMSYGGRQDIVDAAKKIIKENIKPDKLSVDVFSDYLCLADQPDPDFLIRTGGEKRLSNFLPWQSVYSELYFSDKLWPDFLENDLRDAIKEFQRRQRRFGK